MLNVIERFAHWVRGTSPPLLPNFGVDDISVSTETKTVTINVTEEDLEGWTMDGKDCPGYRATKRVFPDIDHHLFYRFRLTKEAGRLEIRIPTEAANKLMDQCRFQLHGSGQTPKVSPFSYQVEVPVHVRTTEPCGESQSA